MTSIPVKAAEKILLSYGPLVFSLDVESLANFTKNGTINQDLSFYLDRVTPEQQQAFRGALTKKIDIHPVLISRFFNTQMGESLLLRLGE